MAPKTRGLSRGAPVAKRKRTVRRPAREPSPSTDSTSSSSTPRASPAAATTQVDRLADRVITTGRKVDFELFEAEGFLVGRQLIEMGWEKICSLDCPTYPSLVKEFYKNLSRGDNGLVSLIRGNRVNITVDLLSRLLNLPVSGPATFSSDDRSPALSRLLNREIVDFEEVQANQLSLELRLLHNICSRILFPKTGRFDYVSERDIFVMDAVVAGRPINLPSMIIWYIADCGSKKKSSLPYGMILTKIFQSQGIVISDSEPQRNLRHTDYYSLATIHRMRFVKKDGIWERKNLLDERATDVGATAPGPSVRHISPGPSSPTPSAAPAPVSSSFVQASTSFSDTQMEQLKSLLLIHKEEMKSELDSKFMNLRETLYSLDERVNKIESTLGSSSEALKNDLKNIFDELKEIGGDSETYSKCNAELQEKITVASAYLDRRLNEFVKTQSEGMSKILEELKRLLRIGF